MARGWRKLAVIGGVLLVVTEALNVKCYALPQDRQVRAAGSPMPVEESATSIDTADRHDWIVDHPNALGLPLMRNMLSDQKAIWTSPAHLRLRDSSWLFPLAVVTAGFLATDRSAIRSISANPTTQRRFVSVSNDGAYAMLGAAGALYLLGRISGDDHPSETGILAGEAAIDSLAVATTFKYSFSRERPYQNQQGAFFRGGDSFPSDHAAVAWSVASVIAHEYPGPLTQLLAYGLATAVSASRVMGQQHFPSDVVVGGAIGWLIGREVYSAHHDPDLGGKAVGSLSESDDGSRRDRRNMGSPFVPLDSWVYPAFETLTALRYVNTAIVGLKPWTRMECARLTEEAGESSQWDGTSNQQASGLQARLQKEFAYELKLLGGGRNLTANLESIYARTISIHGPALTDGDHFGQTVSYDFGRPFERGTNGQAGGLVSAGAGPLAFYVRAEYQHAPSAPALSSDIRSIIAQQDMVPLSLEPSGAAATTNRLQVLDAYVEMNLSNWMVVLGRQSLSWAPGPAGSMLWSDNAEPVNMVRLVNSEPSHLPGILGHLGPIRFDQFVGRLKGHYYVPQPFIYGQKINFRPFSFLELGIGRTVTIGGVGGNPLTTRNFVRSFFGLADPQLGSVPGDNHSAFDWTFYVPKVRNYIVFYGDGYADDDFLPLENPSRNPWHPGIYITRIPGISKLDLHVEGVSTEALGVAGSGTPRNQGQLDYWNATYRDGYTNDGNLIGNTVGRDGRTIQGWLTYRFSPRNTLQFIYKHNTVRANFIPGGGAWQDYALKNETYLSNGLYVRAELQYENISHYPILFNGPQRNIAATLEVGFHPGKRVGTWKNDQ